MDGDLKFFLTVLLALFLIMAISYMIWKGWIPMPKSKEEKKKEEEVKKENKDKLEETLTKEELFGKNKEYD